MLRVTLRWLVARLVPSRRPAGCACPPFDIWHHPVTGHCGDCGCVSCLGER